MTALLQPSIHMQQHLPFSAGTLRRRPFLSSREPKQHSSYFDEWNMSSSFSLFTSQDSTLTGEVLQVSNSPWRAKLSQHCIAGPVPLTAFAG